MSEVTGPAAVTPVAGGHGRGLALVAGAAIVWSTGGLLARMVGTDAWTTIFWRAVFAALFLVCFMLWRERDRTLGLLRGMGLPGFTVATCFAGASICFIIALQITTVAEVVIFLSTVPFIAALLGWVLMREHVRRRSLLTMTTALAGIVIMMANSAMHGALLGDFFAFLGAALFALGAVTIRRHRNLRMTPAICLATLLAAIIALPFAQPFSVTTPDLLFLFLFGFGQFGIGMALFTTGARHVPAAEATLISVLETILAPLWVWLALGENPGAYALAGGILVIGALAVHVALDLRYQRVPPPIV
jgi:drug/metabolite transporter (DMT)-like permease